MKDSLFCAISFRPDGKCSPPPGNGEKVKYSEKKMFSGGLAGILTAS